MRPRSASMVSLGSIMVGRSPARSPQPQRHSDDEDVPRRSSSKNSTWSKESNSEIKAHFGNLQEALQEDAHQRERRKSASKETISCKLLEGDARSHHSRGRREYVLGKLMTPMVSKALDRLCNEIHWNSMTEKELFNKLDENDDGVLSKAEVSRGLRSMGITLLPSELDSVLRAFDTDGNGTIEFDEFFDLLSKHAQELGLGCYKQPEPEYDLIHGFRKGARVKSGVLLPHEECDQVRGSKLGPELDRAQMGATVIGYGEQRGTVKVRFDMSSRTYNVRPEYLTHLPDKEPAPEPPRKKFGGRRRATIE